MRAFLADHVTAGSTVITDGWQPYRAATAPGYTHERLIVPGPQASSLLPGMHRVASLAKRWLLGTHQGSVNHTHLDSYLNEFVFRFNRRRSRSRGLPFYRVLELAVAHAPVRYHDLVHTLAPGASRPDPRPTAPAAGPPASTAHAPTDPGASFPRPTPLG